MPLSSEQISDLIKIGIPSLVTIATAIFAWLTQVALKNKEKELFKLQFSIQKQKSLFENQLNKIDNVISQMGEYFSSYYNVLSALGKVDKKNKASIEEVENSWKYFSEVYKNRTIVISILHTIDAKACLEVLKDNYKLYVELFENHMRSNEFPSHDKLKDFGFKMGAIRNDFYREIGKLQVELSKKA